MLNPAAMSVITVTFTGRAERARAVSIWHAVFGVSHGLRPAARRLVVAAAGWQGIFWMNIPVALAAAALAARFVPESRAARPRRPDPAGQALVIVMLGSLTYAIIEGPAAGWSSPRTVALFAVSAAALAALIAWEPRRAAPMIDLRLFGSLQFSGAIAAAAGTFAAARRLPVPVRPVPAGRPRPDPGGGRAAHRAGGRRRGHLRAAGGPLVARRRPGPRC